MQTRLLCFLSLLVGAIVNGKTYGQAILIIADDFDDSEAVWKVHNHKDVVKCRQALDDFGKKLRRLKDTDMVALFGESQSKSAKTYAMPVAENRGYMMPGAISSDSVARNDFHIVKDIVGLSVDYESAAFPLDFDHPSRIRFYFPVDKSFTRLTEENLQARLAWDENQFKKLIAFYDKRMMEVFPWEIDQKELAKAQMGDFAINAKTKLDAWIASGKKLGYDCGHKDDAYLSWNWPNGKKARSALRDDYNGPTLKFVWYQENGLDISREERFDSKTDNLVERSWYRPAPNNKKSRSEAIGWWCWWYWYDKDGRCVRAEWDDNGDGIPDRYLTKEDDIVQFREEKLYEMPTQKRLIAKRKALKLEDSWAVNPKLIPEECRVPDEPDRRVPIRKRELPKQDK
jgi:hypothetical protein